MGCGGPSTEGSFISPGAWGLNWSDVKRVNRMPTPSIMASSIPPITALPAIAATPPAMGKVIKRLVKFAHLDDL